MKVIAETDRNSVYCPKCGYVMFGKSHDSMHDKSVISCVNERCEDQGKKYLMPNLTVELTPLEA